MLKTTLTIVISVTIFGVLFFLYVKRSLKKRLDYYLSKKHKVDMRKATMVLAVERVLEAFNQKGIWP